MSYEDEVFDPNAVEIEDDFGLIPNGEYLLQASAITVVEKDGGEKVLYKTEFEVIDGDYQGRKIFENYNLRNPSADAVRIGRQQLAKLCLAIGVGPFALHDANDALCWKPFIGKVGVQKDKTGNYDDQNRIKSYKPHNDGQKQQQEPPPRPNQSTARSTQNGGSAATQNQPQVEEAPRRAAAVGGSRPWSRK